MPKGQIRFFHERKSFGFVDRGADPDVFFHISDYDGAYPEEGEIVTFDIEYGGRGPRGLKITPITGKE
ncbi:cold shock domain-containing protein (plasmid) [Haloarcula salina]|uniref:cold shock domain-containing protein n=1 Tax=Haloarcula salina TaxID=1429914 RepID=UPI003C6EAF6F